MVNKKELIEDIVLQHDTRKNVAGAWIDIIFDLIKEKLMAGQTVHINGFGKFETVVRKGKNIRIPDTKEIITTIDKRTIKFTPCTGIKEIFKEEAEELNRQR